jgi:hypothetical protein
MRVLSALVSAAVLCATGVPAAAHGPCTGSRCAGMQDLARLHGAIVPNKCCCPAPAGWGHYLRQRLRDDRRAPLAIADEPGGVALYRD